MPSTCEGVWLPDGTVRCFVEEFRYTSDYALSVDHIIPQSQGGTDDPANLHEVHLGCQNRQGGYIGGQRAVELGVGWHAPGARSRGGKIGGKIGGKRTAELGVGAHAPGAASRAGKRAVGLGVGIHAPGMQSRGGRRTAELGVGIHAPGAKSRGSKTANHNRWHVNRGITSPGCELC